MLGFKVHHFGVKGRNYILFPKLNRYQMRLLAERFTSAGFCLKHGPPVTAMSPELTIHVEPLGLCWSSQDLSDVLLPMVPEVLGCKKEAATLETIFGMYARVFPCREGSIVRFSTRLEMLGNWDNLRASASCGLAPDERLIASSLLRAVGGTCRVVTDFSVAGSAPFSAGGRLYFRSELPVSRVLDTLRTAGTMGRENSYLPRDGTLSLDRLAPTSKDFARSIEELGEWCSFVAD